MGLGLGLASPTCFSASRSKSTSPGARSRRNLEQRVAVDVVREHARLPLLVALLLGLG